MRTCLITVADEIVICIGINGKVIKNLFYILNHFNKFIAPVTD